MPFHRHSIKLEADRSLSKIPSRHVQLLGVFILHPNQAKKRPKDVYAYCAYLTKYTLTSFLLHPGLSKNLIRPSSGFGAGGGNRDKQGVRHILSPGKL